MKFRRRTDLTRTERAVFRIGAAGLGFSLGRIAQELLIELVYPSHGRTVPNVIRLLPLLKADTSHTAALALMYVPVMLTGLLAAGAQILSYRWLSYHRLTPGQKPSTSVLLSSALLAATAHALLLWPAHLLLEDPVPLLLSAAAIKASLVIVSVAARASRGPRVEDSDGGAGLKG